MIGLGLIRILFIISVINFHNTSKVIHWNYFVSGPIAVRLSFILSGFYMEMVYPKYKNIFSFYFSRAIRLYPCYYLSILTSYFLQRVKKIQFYPPIDTKKLSPSAIRLIKFSNIFILFQDDLFFFDQNKQGNLCFIQNHRRSNLLYYIINGVSWSLSVELKFYILVPFLTKFSSQCLFLVFLFSFLIRSYGYSIQKKDFDFSYRFFPYELSLFVLGQLSYRFYSKFKSFLHNFSFYSFITVFCFCFFISFYNHLFYYTGEYYVYVIFIILLPLFFYISKNSIFDRWLGERIYFIYLWHLIFQKIVLKFFNHFFVDGKMFLFTQFLITFFFSIIYEEFIQKPLNYIFKPKYVIKDVMPNTNKKLSIIIDQFQQI